MLKIKKKVEEKNKVLKSAVKLFCAREDIIGFFEKWIFPYKGNVFKTKVEESEEKIEKSINNGIDFIKENSKDINNDLLKKYFDFSKSIDLANKLYETKGVKENKELVEEIRNRWSNLKDEIKKMSREEIKNEKPNDILGIVNEIIDFNKEIQNQAGKGPNLLTPNQMLSRLPITLAQLNAGNNSEKLKNEIRQLLYYLYWSKKLTKNVYKSLVDVI